MNCFPANSIKRWIQLLRFQERLVQTIHKYFTVNFFGDLFEASRIQACSYDDAIHASAAFIASNSLAFISRLISGRNLLSLPRRNWIKFILNAVRTRRQCFFVRFASKAWLSEIIIQMMTARSLIDGKIIQLVNLSYRRLRSAFMARLTPFQFWFTHFSTIPFFPATAAKDLIARCFMR